MSKLDEINAQIKELERQKALIESYQPGQEWQFKNLPGYYKEGIWEDCTSEGPAWVFNQCDYRQKPEPRIIYCNEHVGGFTSGQAYSTPEKARRAVELWDGKPIRIAVPFKEVVE